MHRLTVLLLVAVSAGAQSTLHMQDSHTTESLRGVSTVSRQIAWASGTHGTYLRTSDGGRTWTPARVPGAETLDFRAVVAFSGDEAFLMSAGPGDQSRVYHTADAGRHWQLQFTNTNPKGFFDSMAFWDSHHGILLGDPIPDDSGKVRFELLLTDDGGENWRSIPASQLPEALPGEGAFAASNSCISILGQRKIASAQPPEQPWKSGPSGPALSERATRGSRMGPRQPPKGSGASAPEDPDPNIWFATGGAAARVFHSGDRGQTWVVFDTPVLHGPESAGIFSIAFRNDRDGVIAGGDYQRPDFDGPNVAFTHDGGKTWKIANIHPQAYFSAVGYDRRRDPGFLGGFELPGPARVLMIGPELIYEFGFPNKVRRILRKGKGVAFNAVSPFPHGGALLVGAKGAIAVIP